jgi:two-component system sensor histidine kinase EvgS
MNAVLGYSELLGSTKLDNVQKEYVESLKSSGKSLLRLINDILDISKIEAGKLELEYDFISTTDFFSEFERIFAFKIREKGLSFHLEMGPSIPKGIMVDESRLRQIVFNLLGNAIKFTSEGVIRIQVYTEASTVQKIEEPGKDTVDLFIAVTDTGCGINPEMQDRIFEPFVQERNYSSTGGTGLGLPISRRLVHLMQGTISLASEFGKGSTFVVHIPRVECLREFSGIQPGSHSIPAGIRFGKARLLIIDDVQHNRNYLRDALKDTSIETFEADDGVRGLDMARSLKPDLIISDIRMPGMNGYELLEKIKQDPSIRHIPVIAYSASVLQSQQAALLNSAFSGLLIKPVKLQELYNELKKFLPYELSYVEEAFATPIKFPGGLKDPGDLIRSLETDFHTTWKTFAVRQPIGQICLFADSIIELGTRHNAADVVQYGEELRVAAVNFNIESVLNLLKSYINLISALKKQNPQIPE